MHRYDCLRLCSSKEFSQKRAPRFKCRNSAQYVAITAADHCMWQKVSQENDVDRIRYRTGGAALPVLQNRTITIKSVHQKLQSWIGHCKHCNSYRLRLNLFMRLHYV